MSGASVEQGHQVSGQTPPGIEFVDVSYRDGRPVLDGLSACLPAGQCTVVMGPRRVGKSLLVSLLLGEARPDAGDVWVNGVSVSAMSTAEAALFHEATGVLRGQRAHYGDRLDEADTVAQNLKRPVHEAGVGDVLAHDRAVEWLRLFDLDGVSDQHPSDLEPHSRRRLALAQALIADPPLAILDDPGGGIDVTHLDAEERAIRAWHERTGSTLILTTHSLELARALGDHLVVVVDGRVVAQGEPTELLDGVRDSAEFASRFGGAISHREADPARTRRDLRPAWTSVTWVWFLIISLLVIGVVTIGVFASGLLDKPGG